MNHLGRNCRYYNESKKPILALDQFVLSNPSFYCPGNCYPCCGILLLYWPSGVCMHNPVCPTPQTKSFNCVLPIPQLSRRISLGAAGFSGAFNCFFKLLIDFLSFSWFLKLSWFLQLLIFLQLFCNIGRTGQTSYQYHQVPNASEVTIKLFGKAVLCCTVFQCLPSQDSLCCTVFQHLPSQGSIVLYFSTFRDKAVLCCTVFQHLPSQGSIVLYSVSAPSVTRQYCVVQCFSTFCDKAVLCCMMFQCLPRQLPAAAACRHSGVAGRARAQWCAAQGMWRRHPGQDLETERRLRTTLSTELVSNCKSIVTSCRCFSQPALSLSLSHSPFLQSATSMFTKYGLS